MRERAQDDALELGRVVADERRGRRELALQNRVHDLVIALAAERALAGGRLVEHAAEREDVAPAIDGAARDLLGRHVRDLALELPGARLLVELAERLRDAEVADLRDAVGGDEDVVRGDVAMHDAERAPVVVVELVRGVERRRTRRRRCAPRRAESIASVLPFEAQDARERVAVDPLHREVERASAPRRARRSRRRSGGGRREAMRASSRNIRSNSGSSARCGRIVLIATSFWKPRCP